MLELKSIWQLKVIKCIIEVFNIIFFFSTAASIERQETLGESYAIERYNMMQQRPQLESNHGGCRYVVILHKLLPYCDIKISEKYSYQYCDFCHIAQP